MDPAEELQLNEDEQEDAVVEEELITDFSTMFKANGGAKRMPRLSSADKTSTKTPNWLLEIPAKLDIDREEVVSRKNMNDKRWKCMVRANQNQNKTLAAVVSCWNFLFSTLGQGHLEPLSLYGLEKVLDKSQPNQQMSRSQQTLGYFQTICEKFKVQGASTIVLKLAEPNIKQLTLADLHIKLSDNKRSFVYITHKNVICPVGYDRTPIVPLDAYKRTEHIASKDLEQWIMTCPTGRQQPSFMIKRWKDVQTDLSTAWPNYFDLQDCKKGQQRHSEATVENENDMRGTENCIIQLVRL